MKSKIFLIMMSLILLALPLSFADTGLIANYRFSECEGNTTFDSSGNGLNGLLYTTDYYSDMWSYNGKSGCNVIFDGTDDYINFSNSNKLDMEKITISLWIKTDLNNIGYRAILTKFKSGSLSYAIVSDNNVIEWFVSGDGTTWNLVNDLGADGFIYNNGSWNNIIAEYDGIEGRIYANGVLNATGGNAGNIFNSTASLFIGNSEYGGQEINANIDEVKIWNRILSQTEITNIVNPPIPPSLSQNNIDFMANPIVFIGMIILVMIFNIVGLYSQRFVIFILAGLLDLSFGIMMFQLSIIFGVVFIGFGIYMFSRGAIIN